MSAVAPQAEEALVQYGPSVERLAVTAASAVAIYLVGRYVAVPAIVRVIRARNRQNPTIVNAVERYARLAVLVVVAAVTVGVAGYGDLLGGSAIVVAALTLAIGVAGQAVIGNLVSGLFLVADPEFNVDDWIEWEGGEGTVETIRFRVTRVRTLDGEVITVPNTTLATSEVRRPYSRDRFRVVVRVGIAHDEDSQRARAVLRDSMAVVQGVLEDPRPTVVVDELGADALWLRAQFWVGNPSRRGVIRARSTYVAHAQERLREEEIAFSPPSEHALSGRLDVDGIEGRP